jgi:AcrR family transcriptional regulator
MRIVKPARRVSKRERAEQTRARIMEAAYRLFTQHGYEATTMQAVADEAGVAVQTVYFTFHTKGGLLAAIETRAGGGGEEGHDWRERQHLALLEERDARKVMAMWVAGTAVVLKRLTAFVELLGASLQMDTESVERRSRERDRWFQLLIDRLVALNALKPELTPSRSMDIARGLVRLETHQEMTQHWGWSDEEWIEWMTGVLGRELLDGRLEARPHATKSPQALNTRPSTG